MTLTFTFAGDESGDVSLKFAKGASQYFVVTMIATKFPDNLRRMLEKIRTDSGLPERYEFGYHRLSSAQLRKRVFSTLSIADFDIWAILVNKVLLSEAFKAMSGLDFYLFFVSELIRQIPDQSVKAGL